VTDDIWRIEYRQGMIETRKEAAALPPRVWSGTEIPEEVRTAIRAERLAELSGTYGDPQAGDPIQYDQLTLTFPRSAVKLELFNRAILLFLTDDERIQRIHHVLCKLDKAGAAASE